jgi:hypothetical protein
MRLDTGGFVSRKSRFCSKSRVLVILPFRVAWNCQHPSPSHCDVKCDATLSIHARFPRFTDFHPRIKFDPKTLVLNGLVRVAQFGTAGSHRVATRRLAYRTPLTKRVTDHGRNPERSVAVSHVALRSFLPAMAPPSSGIPFCWACPTHGDNALKQAASESGVSLVEQRLPRACLMQSQCRSATVLQRSF